MAMKTRQATVLDATCSPRYVSGVRVLAYGETTTRESAGLYMRESLYQYDGRFYVRIQIGGINPLKLYLGKDDPNFCLVRIKSISARAAHRWLRDRVYFDPAVTYDSLVKMDDCD